MQLAPIILFAYNRPWHLQQTLQSLSENVLANESELFIYCDGPKENASVEVLKTIAEARAVARQKKWCKTVTVIEAEKNKGLAKSIIAGVTETVNNYSRVIVIEDDVLLSKYFLQFMNDALETYKSNEKVMSIGSWNYFCAPELLQDNFFYRFPDSIAWATFDRAWKLFEADEKLALQKLNDKKEIDRFNANLPTPYFSSMLQQQIEGKINSWAIRWTATAIIHDKLSFFPKQTLSKHIGFGSSATHETNELDYNSHLVLAEKRIPVKVIPVEENLVAIGEWRKFIIQNFIPKTTTKGKLRSLIGKVTPAFVKKLLRKK